MYLKKIYGLILLIFFVLFPETVLPSTPIYSIIGGGAGYRDYITEESDYNLTVSSPYFEFGAGNYRRNLFGLNGSIILDPTDTSEIKQFLLGTQVKFFVVPRIFYLGTGVGVHIESKDDENIESSGNNSVSINDPKFFLLANVSLGVTIDLFQKKCLLIETSYYQTVRDPYPFSANIIMGILAFY